MWMERRGAALIVIEGAARLQWRRVGERFTLVGLHPDRTEKFEIVQHLWRGGPLLVVFDGPPGRVPALAEEVQGQVPEGLRLVPSGDGVDDLELPVLEWLPQPDRARGRRFAVSSLAVEMATPSHLLLPLIMDRAPTTSRLVRFARATRNCRRPMSGLLDSARASLYGEQHPVVEALGA